MDEAVKTKPPRSREPKAVGRDQLADAVYRNSACQSRREARELVDQVLDEIIEGLAQDTTVSLSGFGVFKLAAKPERPGRNPKTGEQHVISSRRTVRFRASQIVRRVVTKGAEQDA